MIGRRRKRVAGRVIGASTAEDGTWQPCVRFNRNEPAMAAEGPQRPPEACRVPEAMAERLKPKIGR